LAPVLPLLFLVLLSSLTSTFKIQFPIATGSNMSVSYVVDIASLILRGPHATMIVGAVSGWSQTVLSSRTRNPLYRTMFNMSCLALTVEAAGQVYVGLGGTSHPDATSVVPLVGMALTYFFVNTIPIAFAIALTTDQKPWIVWKSEFAPTAGNYLIGAVAAAAVIAVMESAGTWLTLLVSALPLYLTYKVYRAGEDSEARQGAILEAAHDAIISTDQQLRIREFNPAAERMFGYPRMGLLGKPVEILLSPARRAEQLAAIARFQAAGDGPLAGRQIETLARRADGNEFPIELSVARVANDSRTLVTGFVRDITERHALEEQLRQSQKLEAVGRLASGVAHDFNNILMSILGAADLILMQLGPQEPARTEASEIKVSVQRGAGLTRQLLAFSRRQATVPRLVVLQDVVSSMEIMLRRLIGTEADFEVVSSPRPTMIVADPAQIEQVVLNLVINARDAMPEGGRLTVRVDDVDGADPVASVHVQGHAGHYAHLSVSDTGTGIDETTRSRLFEPFFTTKEEGKGSGLGLSIVYGIVKQNDGYVAVVSERGKGATFHVYLPLANASVDVPPVPATPSSSRSPVPGATS
jgi:PAS domain S-box-containing protein